MFDSLGPAGGWALAALALFTPLALWFAGRFGFCDPRPGAAPLERKRGQSPSAPVGGLLLGALALVALLLPEPNPAGGNVGAVLRTTGIYGLALVAVPVLFGLVDDAARNGLAPLPKVLGQCAVGLAVWEVHAALLGVDALGGFVLHSPGLILLVGAAVLGTVGVVNVVNTFDHADGLVLSMGALAFVVSLPVVGFACLLLLPFNLRPGSARLPKLFLGDSGSHLLGALIIVSPGAWPLLTVPALDLTRVVIARLAAGQAPWLGDRRHLGQVLARAGWSNLAGTLAVAAAMFPASPSAELGALGPALSALLYLTLLVLARRGLAGGAG